MNTKVLLLIILIFLCLQGCVSVKPDQRGISLVNLYQIGDRSADLALLQSALEKQGYVVNIRGNFDHKNTLPTSSYMYVDSAAVKPGANLKQLISITLQENINLNFSKKYRHPNSARIVLVELRNK